jgi:hypothetical protein
MWSSRFRLFKFGAGPEESPVSLLDLRESSDNWVWRDSYRNPERCKPIFLILGLLVARRFPIFIARRTEKKLVSVAARGKVNNSLRVGLLRRKEIISANAASIPGYTPETFTS